MFCSYASCGLLCREPLLGAHVLGRGPARVQDEALGLWLESPPQVLEEQLARRIGARIAAEDRGACSLGRNGTAVDYPEAIARCARSQHFARQQTEEAA